MVADFGTLTDDIQERESTRFQHANYGKFLEERFITGDIGCQAMADTPYTRTAACRLNVLRAYSSYLRSFSGLKEGEFGVLNNLYPQTPPVMMNP